MLHVDVDRHQHTNRFSPVEVQVLQVTEVVVLVLMEFLHTWHKPLI